MKAADLVIDDGTSTWRWRAGYQEEEDSVLERRPIIHPHCAPASYGEWLPQYAREGRPMPTVVQKRLDEGRAVYDLEHDGEEETVVGAHRTPKR